MEKESKTKKIVGKVLATITVITIFIIGLYFTITPMILYNSNIEDVSAYSMNWTDNDKETGEKIELSWDLDSSKGFTETLIDIFGTGVDERTTSNVVINISSPHISGKQFKHAIFPNQRLKTLRRSEFYYIIDNGMGTDMENWFKYGSGGIITINFGNQDGDEKYNDKITDAVFSDGRYGYETFVWERTHHWIKWNWLMWLWLSIIVMMVIFLGLIAEKLVKAESIKRKSL